MVVIIGQTIFFFFLFNELVGPLVLILRRSTILGTVSVMSGIGVVIVILIVGIINGKHILTLV